MGRQVLISTKESFRQGSEWEYLGVKKKIRYRLCERASSRFGNIVRGLSRYKELVGRLQWSLEVSSFPSSCQVFSPFCG